MVKVGEITPAGDLRMFVLGMELVAIHLDKYL
jgi:hypothetical protein